MNIRNAGRGLLFLVPGGFLHWELGFGSVEIFAVNANPHIHSNQTEDKTHQIAGHYANMGSQPPASPTEN